MDALHTAGVDQLAALVHNGEVSSLELVTACLERISELDGEVRAWVRTCPETALERARELDSLLQAGVRIGPLHGIPFGVKDIFDTAGLETESGSPSLKGFVPAQDAEVVRRMREAGAVLLGKTETTQFAYFDPAPTRNPWNTAHTPGGSSSGSAAAVACGMCPAAFGSQTGGSIIRPSSFCGIAGIKPTRERISRRGMTPLARSLDHAGPMARSVRDLAVLLDVVWETSEREEEPRFRECLERPPATLKIGVPDRYFDSGLDPAMAEAFSSALKTLGELGLEVSTVSPPASFEAGAEAGKTIFAAEAAAYHRDHYERHAGDYRPKILELVEKGLRITAVEYLRAMEDRHRMRRDFLELFQRVDLVASPAAPGPAPQGLESTGDPVFNAPFTTIGFPALTVPMGLSPAGLPLGLQLAGPPLSEANLLAAGNLFETKTALRPGTAGHPAS
jgi:Asp-tRNA(Asn)/Glu-tRNA(Gln) amidotransferase A subunit family amidase